MKNFNTTFNTLVESLSLPVLSPSTTLEDLMNTKTIKVYRSSAKPNKMYYKAGFHAGTEDQAYRRADYQVNDEELYDRYYLYELILKVGNVYPKLVEDKGEDHGADFGSELSNEYDLLVYKNTGEGDYHNYENLSIIGLNPNNIVSSKMVKELSSEELEHYVEMSS